MANCKTVAVIHSILTLYERGWSQRRIAWELAIGRETARRYLARQSGDSNGAISTAGTAGPGNALPAKTSGDNRYAGSDDGRA